MKAYEITFQKRGAVGPITWIRWADSVEAARESVTLRLKEEYERPTRILNIREVEIK